MNRQEWLAPFAVKRAELLAEYNTGISLNALARKYEVSYTTIAKKIKKAKEEYAQKSNG